MKKRAWIIFLFGLLAALLLASCAGDGGSGASSADWTRVSVEELQGMMENKDFILVNTHIPFEGDLPQTDLSIPYNQIEQNLDQLPDKDAKIVLYCRSGSMSTSAARELVEAGYTNLYELEGGFNAWKQAGLPMEP